MLTISVVVEEFRLDFVERVEQAKNNHFNYIIRNFEFSMYNLEEFYHRIFICEQLKLNPEKAVKIECNVEYNFKSAHNHRNALSHTKKQPDTSKMCGFVH